MPPLVISSLCINRSITLWGHGWGSYGKLAVLSLIEHKESSHERPMGLVFQRVMQSFTGHGPCPAPSVRMIPFDFHRCLGGPRYASAVPTARAAAARAAISSYPSCDKRAWAPVHALGCERGKRGAGTLRLRPPISCTGVLHPDALPRALRRRALGS